MPVLIFLKGLAVSTLSQIASLLGVVFLFGLLIDFFSHMTFKSIENAFWSKGTYVVAWLGTPIHELGHALFCVIFMHRIAEIQLFKPDPLTGTLGYVSHKWNRSNPWQVLGNVFIAIGPVILGGIILFGLFYFLVPGSSLAWNHILSSVSKIQDANSVRSYPEVIGTSALTMTGSIFAMANLTGWKIWVFFYLSICVASNIRLSLLDIKGSLPGLGYFVLMFLLINLVSLIPVIGRDRLFHLAAPLLGIVYSLLIVALVMAVLGFIVVYSISALYVKIMRKHMLNPFD